MKADYKDYFKMTLGGFNLKDYVYFESEYAFRHHFDRTQPPGALLDFGGRIGEKTRRIGNVVVCEVDGSARRWMSEHGVKHVASIDKVENGSVGTVYASHVLEHLENPMEFLFKFNAKLGRKGRLIIVVPAEVQSLEPKAPIVDPNGHIQCWNFATLMTSLDRAGFKVVKWRYNVFIWTLKLSRMQNRKLMLRLMDLEEALSRRRSYRFMLFSLYYWLRPFSRLLPWMDPRLELLAVAEKK
ncbi:MAG: methyltransferase domain-containing protein [Candidatus Micrarchaeota archaeon]|nr:methyltransferase domain-containing protein [Candidatus Micrarchaeota archaeon]